MEHFGGGIYVGWFFAAFVAAIIGFFKRFPYFCLPEETA